MRDAAWRTVPGVGVPGAYRLEQSFRTTTLWVDHQGALERRGRVGSVQLVKHLAARASRAPLLGYLETPVHASSSRSALTCPACTDASPRCAQAEPPVVSVKTRSIGYRDVPRRVADALNSLLAS